MRYCFILFLFACTAHAQPSGGWLDSPPMQWNRPGGAIPNAPENADREEIPKICMEGRPLPKTAQERAAARAGWMLFATFDDRHGLTVIGAAANFDGMCRADQYQDFVFVNGKFAGTLSPKPMGARSDGSSITITFPATGKIVATFDRYVPRDPLCCPSRISEGEYAIGERAGNPIVVLKKVLTRPAETH
jgi:hypothetical protein